MPMATVNAENIPARFKQREKWLLWDGSSDTPRRPHWRGDFSISWSDPDDWHTFEEALEASQERDSWGVGYVFTPDDDEYMIDVDGGYTDDDEPREWFPGPDRFTDAGAYFEWSPSGDSIHIPVEGEPPKWWKDCEVAPDVHQGVDVLTNKFCTFTGAKHPESGDDVTDTNAAPFLFNVYQNIRGESPRLESDEPDSGQDYDDEWLNDDDVRDALDTITPDVPHNEWIKLGYAVHDHDSGSGGKSLFESWSQSGEKWDEQAQRSIDSIWNNARQGSDVTVGTLVRKAKQSGWELPTPDGGGTVAATGGDASTGLGGGADSIPKPTGPGDLVEKNGGYYRRTFYDEEPELKEITNFQLEVLSRLSHEGDTKQFRLRVHPNRGETYKVTVEPVVFNEVRRFKREVPTGWNTTFEGGEKELNLLKKFVGEQNAKLRDATGLIGLHGEEWVTPDGSLTSDGWADDPTTVFAGKDSPLKTKWSLSPKGGSDPDTATVARILELLPRTRTAERFLPVLGWFYAAPLRPLVMDWEGEFNTLNVLGDTGAGKTATLELLWQAFGMENELLRADGTPFPIMRALASSNALPVVFDEYKPSDMRDSRLDKLHSYIRTSTRGGIEQKGNPDMSVNEFHLRAPACISGEQPLQGPAEERRSILTTFTREATVESTEFTEAFMRLSGGEFDGTSHDGLELGEHALAYYQWILSLDKGALHEKWLDARGFVTKLLREKSLTGLDDIVVQGYQTVVFGCRLYQQFARDMGLSPDEIPVTNAELEGTIQYLSEEGSGAEHRSHLDRFLGLAGRAAASDYLEEGEHYTLVNRNSGRPKLVVDLGTGFDKVRRYVREHDVSGEDLLDNANDYRGRIRDAEDRDGSYILDTSLYTREIGRGFAVDVGRAEESVDSFSIRRFVDPEGDIDVEPITTPKGQVRTHIANNFESGDTFTAAEIAGELPEFEPSVVERELGKAVTEGVLHHSGTKYEVL